MPEIIFDNCVLSNFAMSDLPTGQAGSLNIIKTFYADKAYITDFASAENLRGILKGYKGLIMIRDAVRDGWLKEITLKGKKEKALFESLSVSLGFGEASSIAVAKTRGFIFACDDKTARKEASLLGVKLTGTIGILIKAVRRNLVDLKQADEILNHMIAYGFYSPVGSIKKAL